jgi:hypothetical protein
MINYQSIFYLGNEEVAEVTDLFDNAGHNPMIEISDEITEILLK